MVGSFKHRLCKKGLKGRVREEERERDHLYSGYNVGTKLVVVGCKTRKPSYCPHAVIEFLYRL
jgi:hypothetical protein